MLARCAAVVLAILLGSISLFAQTVPVRAKVRTTNEITVNGKIVKATVAEASSTALPTGPPFVSSGKWAKMAPWAT
jgi:hypothetical protein